MDIEQFFRNRSILVTGGSGAIGSNLVRALLRLGVSQVRVLDDLSSSVEWNLPKDPRLRLQIGSICRADDLQTAFQDRPSIVFHLAAFFANQNSVDHPEADLAVNGAGSLALFKACDPAFVERVVHASTSAIDDERLQGARGLAELSLKTPYQITKTLGELYGGYFFRQHGLSCTTVRIFNSYGPGELPGPYRNVIPNFIWLALKGEPLPVIGDGSSTRDYTFVDDIVAGFLCAASRVELQGHCLRLSSRVSTTALDLAQLINRLTGNPAGIRSVDPRSWETPHRHLRADVQSLPGWTARVNLVQGLGRTIRWFQDHRRQIDDALRNQVETR